MAGISIPIQAELNDDDAKRQLEEFSRKINELQNQVARAGNLQLSPISVKTNQEMENMIRQFQVLSKLSQGLNNRINVTGQKGKNFTDMDWSQMYPQDNRRRDVQLAQVLNAVAGKNIPISAIRGGGRDSVAESDRREEERRRKRDADFSPAKRAGNQIMNSGLNAFGPAGNVISGSLSAGAKGGFGAGMFGLLGGLAALGIGKAVSGVMEKVSVAENNATSIDTLKRTVGDVNVSFSKLKSELGNAASDLKLTYAETNTLAKSFANLSNITDRQYGQLATEVVTAGGFSRSFGMDPSQGVGFFGQMRGMRSSANDADSRKLAILMGETIAKSGAFSQADKVLASVTQFTARQQANTLNRANIADYAGWYASAVSTGRAGMTPDNVTNMLASIDSAIYQGGAKGEASQFFTGMLGNKLGLNPMQMGIFSQGGAFSTMRQMFGKGSMAYDAGVRLPDGALASSYADKTMMQLQLEQVKKIYGHMGPEFQANAIMGQFGVNWGQAMALMDLNPSKMGELQQYLGKDYKNLNPSAISSIARVVTGTDQDRNSVINSLMNRSGDYALSSDDLGLLNSVAGADPEKQKKVLTQLLSKYGQEETEGSIARDSKNLLDNIKTSLADKLVPLTNDIRLGVMHLAGDGKKTPDEIIQEILSLERNGKFNAIDARYDSQVNDLIEQRKDTYYSPLAPPPNAGELDEKRQSVNKKILDLRMQQKKEREAMQARLDQEDRDRENAQALLNGVDENKPAANMSQNSVVSSDATEGFDPYSSPGGATATANGYPIGGGEEDSGTGLAVSVAELDPDLSMDQAENLDRFMQYIKVAEGTNSHNYHTAYGGSYIDDLSGHPETYSKGPNGKTSAAGAYQIVNSTYKPMADKLGLTDFSPESQDKIAFNLIKSNPKAYEAIKNGDYETASKLLSGVWVSLPGSKNKKQRSHSVAHLNSTMENIEASPAIYDVYGNMTVSDDDDKTVTPKPADSFENSVYFEPLKILLMNQNGKPAAEPVTVSPIVKPAKGFGR